MIKETTGVDSLISENIPEELTERPQWVCWRYEERDGKLTKVPKTYRGTAASSTDESTWTTFKYAVAAVGQTSGAGADGIGFVFSDADPFCGIDLDNCRNPETGDIAEWAQEILDRVGDGYVEISPSGRGIHIIVEGTVRGGGMRRGPVEMYSRGRYFTITGKPL